MCAPARLDIPACPRLLDRRLNNGFRRLMKSGVDHLKPGVAESPCDNSGPRSCPSSPVSHHHSEFAFLHRPYHLSAFTVHRSTIENFTAENAVTAEILPLKTLKPFPAIF